MAYVQGKEIKEGPTQFPANPKLWNMYVAQAKSKFRVYPSPASAHWVHAHYAQSGGQFVPRKSQIDPRFRDYVQEGIDKKLADAKSKVTKPVENNFNNQKQSRG